MGRSDSCPSGLSPCRRFWKNLPKSCSGEGRKIKSPRASHQIASIMIPNRCQYEGAECELESEPEMAPGSCGRAAFVARAQRLWAHAFSGHHVEPGQVVHRIVDLAPAPRTQSSWFRSTSMPAQDMNPKTTMTEDVRSIATNPAGILRIRKIKMIKMRVRT